MNRREIKIETNNFEPDFLGNFIYDQSSKEFVKKVEIDLNELCAKYFLEEFDDLYPVNFYGQFPALNYLIDNIIEFKFKGGHPGASKDPRKENSRVLGQTICRYFVEKTFGKTYMANIGTLIGRKLPSEFSHISINRKLEGDTPDFLFMNNQNVPCLAEAKGRRNPVSFDDNEFSVWRKQFERVEVKINGNVTEVKGYITQFAIANENNMMPNSILYIEDPKLQGEVYREGNLDKLIKFAHYERLLSKTFLNFIGNSLLSEDKLSKSQTFSVDVYKVGGIKSLENHEIVAINYDRYIFGRNRNFVFMGIDLNVLKYLLNVARGNEFKDIEDPKFENFNSVFFQFSDGFIVCNFNLLQFVERREI